MKSVWMIAIVGLMSLSAVAAADSSGAASSATSKRPCKQLMREIHQACQGAGFIKGQWKQGNGLWRNCVRPVMHGQTVKGVSANPQLLQACQAKRAAHHRASGG